MKAILISIQPKWVAKILNGEKTIEIRRTMLKCDLPIDVYIYCTKDKDFAYKCINGGYDCDNWKVLENRDNDSHILNGKVVAKFTLYGCLNIAPKYLKNWITTLNNACLTEEEYINYSKGKPTCGWVIDDLVIFDKPKELSEFQTPRKLIGYGMTCNYYSVRTLTKAPQSFMFIEV